MHNQTRRWWARSLLGGPVAILLGVLCVGLGACGTNFNELLFQAASATGRTAFDLWLTDQMNELANPPVDGDNDPMDGDDGDADDADGSDDADDVDDADGDDSDGGGLVDLTGDPSAGEPVYSTNGCAACHCVDAAGGCALDGPGLIGVDAAALDDYLRGDTPHVSKVDLADQQIVDLEAYLASLGG